MQLIQFLDRERQLVLPPGTMVYRDNLQVTTGCFECPFTVNLQKFLSRIYEH